MAQLMPLPFTVSCSSKIQTGLTFLVPAHPGCPGQRVVKRVCVCVCVSALNLTHWHSISSGTPVLESDEALDASPRSAISTS